MKSYIYLAPRHHLSLISHHEVIFNRRYNFKCINSRICCCSLCPESFRRHCSLGKVGNKEIERKKKIMRVVGKKTYLLPVPVLSQYRKLSWHQISSMPFVRSNLLRLANHYNILRRAGMSYSRPVCEMSWWLDVWIWCYGRFRWFEAMLGLDRFWIEFHIETMPWTQVKFVPCWPCREEGGVSIGLCHALDTTKFSEKGNALKHY